MTAPTHPTPTPHPPLPPLLVVPWPDTVTDELGFDPRSSYVETFWLPLLGPTTTWLLRRLATEFESSPDGFSLDAEDAARSIGIGTKGGRRGPFHRAIERSVRFGLAHRGEHDILAVRRHLPPLTRAQVSALPRAVRAAHERWQHDRRAGAGRPNLHDHAARLARSLLDVGATPEEVEDQLQRWNFDATERRRALAIATAP